MQVLEPIELLVKELSKTNINLLIAEGVFIFSLNKFQQSLATEMIERLFCESENLIENIDKNTDSGLKYRLWMIC